MRRKLLQRVNSVQLRIDFLERLRVQDDFENIGDVERESAFTADADVVSQPPLRQHALLVEHDFP
jgi:hypothetical protein